MIQYQILSTSIIRIVWHTVRSIANEILGVNGLRVPNGRKLKSWQWPVNQSDVLMVFARGYQIVGMPDIDCNSCYLSYFIIYTSKVYWVTSIVNLYWDCSKLVGHDKIIVNDLSRISCQCSLISDDIWNIWFDVDRSLVFLEISGQWKLGCHSDHQKTWWKPGWLILGWRYVVVNNMPISISDDNFLNESKVFENKNSCFSLS